MLTNEQHILNVLKSVRRGPAAGEDETGFLQTHVAMVKEYQANVPEPAREYPFVGKKVKD